MARVKGGLNAKKKHNRILKLAKGYRGASRERGSSGSSGLPGLMRHAG